MSDSWDFDDWNKNKKLYFKYLCKLRDSKITNLSNACEYLALTFGLDIKVANKILAYWMDAGKNLA